MNELIRVAIGHAPPKHREALLSIFALDAALGRIVATTTEPLIGQMRLTWWHERLVGLDRGELTAEPVLAALQGVIRDYDVTGLMLAELVEGWEALFEPLPLEIETLKIFAARRGNRLFDLAARVMVANISPGLGAGWALIDFAEHCSDEHTARRCWETARIHFEICAINGPKPLRILARINRVKAIRPFDRLKEKISRWVLVTAVLH